MSKDSDKSFVVEASLSYFLQAAVCWLPLGLEKSLFESRLVENRDPQLGPSEDGLRVPHGY